MSDKHRWSSNGYDAEELYFEKLNRELIHKLHSKDARKDATSETKTKDTNAKVIPFPAKAAGQPTAKQKKAA